MATTSAQSQEPGWPTHHRCTGARSVIGLRWNVKCPWRHADATCHHHLNTGDHTYRWAKPNTIAGRYDHVHSNSCTNVGLHSNAAADAITVRYPSRDPASITG